LCDRVCATTGGCTSDPAPRGDWRPPAEVNDALLRAFSPDSWWNLPVPQNAPDNPGGDEILRYLSTPREAGEGCVHLAGSEGNSWGQSVHWAQPGDPTYRVTVEEPDAPPELLRLRIPRVARAAGNNDESMTIFDVDRGSTVALTDAAHDADAGAWSASGASVTYLDSNGLDARTGKSSDERNAGSRRGNNGAVMMARPGPFRRGRVRCRDLSLRRRDPAGQQRFGTSFQRFDPTPENEARAFRSVEEMIGRTGGEVAETHVGRPSAERPMGKEECRALLDPPGTRKKCARPSGATSATSTWPRGVPDHDRRYESADERPRVSESCSPSVCL